MAPAPPSPPGPPALRSFASGLAEGLLSTALTRCKIPLGSSFLKLYHSKLFRSAVDTADEVTDISLSASCHPPTSPRGSPRGSPSSTCRPASRSSQRTVESDSLEESPKLQIKEDKLKLWTIVGSIWDQWHFLCEILGPRKLYKMWHKFRMLKSGNFKNFLIRIEHLFYNYKSSTVFFLKDMSLHKIFVQDYRDYALW